VTRQRSRPFGVAFLSVLIMAVGVIEVVGGILLLVQRLDEDLLATVDVSAAQITTYALFTAMFGVIVFLIGLALRSGAGWARYVVAVLAAVRLASLIWVVVSYHSIHWYTAIWALAIYALVAGYLLFDDDAKAYYSRATHESSTRET
jgi:hypothetical protein